ncbi:putative alpha/beta hydrolase [Mycolicibacterium sp. Dal123E01]|uniref:putative alpha/beta hydrolase n=1 Tax=Mycolicibacterium sp. Dal123E01 TaxID=3457578 RepID=UPI00403E7E78
MTEYPSLVHIDVAALIGEAGGDPWQVDETLQSGDPGQIAELGRAFYSAGDCTAETYAEFSQAQARFQQSWNRENGEHPINDSAEVQRATTGLLVQRDQLPAIGADLSTIAADLAEAQRFSDMHVDNLNTQLHYLDAMIDQALTNKQDTSALEDNAISLTSSALQQVAALRDDYGTKLEASLTDLRVEHDYDPAGIEDVDGDGEAGPEERGRESTDYYDANQRAKDEALVNGGGPMTPEKAAAAARLHDLTTATDPAADPDARKLAGERLDDFRMANFVGPLPRDPILGEDARQRAQRRLDLQQQLEQGGLYNLPPMTPDQATQQLDSGEQFGRVVAVKQAMFALTSQGMSEDGAKAVLNDILHRGNNLAEYTGPASAGVEAYGERIPGGRHAKLEDLLSPADAGKWAHIAGHVGKVGDLIQLANAATDRANGGSNEEFGSALGGVAGGSAAAWGAAAVAGSFTGPWTTAAIVVAASVVGGVGGEQIGGGLGSLFDPAFGPAGGGGGSW